VKKFEFTVEEEAQDELILSSDIELTFGSKQFFVDTYNQRVEHLVGNFLKDNVNEVFCRNDSDEEKKEQLSNLIDAYFSIRTEFEKHKSKIVVEPKFNHIWNE
jgi:uncharacterized protein (DUF2344 family)